MGKHWLTKFGASYAPNTEMSSSLTHYVKETQRSRRRRTFTVPVSLQDGPLRGTLAVNGTDGQLM